MKARAIVLAFGESGSGKTTLIRSLVRATPRLVIADITGDFEGVATTYTSAAEAAVALQAAGDGPFRIRLAANLEQLATRSYAAPGAAVPGERIGLQAAALALAATSCVLVLDELATWCNPNFCPAVLGAIASLGRHASVSLIGTSRRPSEVSRKVTQAGPAIVCAFQTTEPADLEFLRSRFGRHVDELPRLAPHHYLVAGELGILEAISRPAPRLDSRFRRVITLGASTEPNSPAPVHQ